MNTRRYISLIIGALVLIILVGVFLVKVPTSPLSPKLTFQVTFPDVRGLREHSKVSYLGLPAGYVTALEVEQGDQNRPYVVVTLAVPKQLRLPKNIDVRITPTVLGETYVAITLPESVADQEQIVQGERLTNGEVATPIDYLVPGFDDKLAGLQPSLEILDSLTDKALKGLASMFVEKGSDGKTPFDAYADSIAKITSQWKGDDAQGVKNTLLETVSDLREIGIKFNDFMKPDGKGDRPNFSTTIRKLNDLMERSTKAAAKLEGAAAGLSNLKHTGEAITDAANAVSAVKEKIMDIHPGVVGGLLWKEKRKPAMTPKAKVK